MYYDYISSTMSGDDQFAWQFWFSLKDYHDDVTEVSTRAGLK